MKRIRDTIITFNKIKYSYLSYFLMAISIFTILFTTNYNLRLINSFMGAITSSIYILLILYIFIINSIIISKKIYTKSPYIIRNNNKKKYLKRIIIDNLIINLYCFIIIIFFSLIVVYFRIDNKSLALEIGSYGFPLIYYVMFFVIRMFLILSFLTHISQLIILFGKDKLNYFYIIILTLVSMFFSDFMVTVSSIKDFKLFYGYYFQIINYSSFYLELFNSICLIIIYYIFCNLINYFYIKLTRGYNV